MSKTGPKTTTGPRDLDIDIAKRREEAMRSIIEGMRAGMRRLDDLDALERELNVGTAHFASGGEGHADAHPNGSKPITKKTPVKRVSRNELRPILTAHLQAHPGTGTTGLLKHVEQTTKLIPQSMAWLTKLAVIRDTMKPLIDAKAVRTGIGRGQGGEVIYFLKAASEPRPEPEHAPQQAPAQAPAQAPKQTRQPAGAAVSRGGPGSESTSMKGRGDELRRLCIDTIADAGGKKVGVPAITQRARDAGFPEHPSPSDRLSNIVARWMRQLEREGVVNKYGRGQRKVAYTLRKPPIRIRKAGGQEQDPEQTTT